MSTSTTARSCSLANKKAGRSITEVSASAQAIDSLGGPTAVVRLLKQRGIEVTPWAVSKWRARLPGKRVLLIEELTEFRFRAEELRPDLYRKAA